MMNIKPLLACGLIMLPLMGQAQDCCKKGNDVIETIMSRRSIRKYLDKTVEHEKLATVAKCGINAPSALNQQTWAVRVVEDQNFIKETTEIFKKEKPEQVKRDANFKNMYRNAPNIIVVATPKGDSWGLLNAGLLGENMMIAAKALGLGTCCLGSAARFLQDTDACKPYVAKLNLPNDYEICYVLAIGYPNETPEAKQRDESKIEYIK
jgi:nitroreductase